MAFDIRDVDWGTVGSAGAIAGAAKLIKSMVAANNVNKYAKRSGVNYDVGRFFGGDADAALKQIDYQQKLNYNQRVADALAQRGGMPAGTPLEAVEKIYSSEVAPYNLEQAKQTAAGARGRKELEGLPKLLQFLGASDNAAGAQPGATVLPSNPAYNVPSNPNLPALEMDPAMPAPQQGSFTAGANYQEMPELPEYITPETLRSMMGYANTRRGQEVTMRGQDLTRTTAQERIAEQKRYHDAQMKNMLAKLGIDQRRLQLYAKSIAMRSRRAPTKVEVAQQMLKNGEIGKQQFQDFILKTQGMDLFGGLFGGGGPSIPGASDADAEADAYVNGE